MVHYDGIENGVPSGDRGLVLMENMHSVEKVLGVDTFVLATLLSIVFTHICLHWHPCPA